MTKKQIRRLAKIFSEIEEAIGYVAENSPASYAIAVPYASLCSFICEECGLTGEQVEKLLKIKFGPVVGGKNGKSQNRKTS